MDHDYLGDRGCPECPLAPAPTALAQATYSDSTEEEDSAPADLPSDPSSPLPDTEDTDSGSAVQDDEGWSPRSGSSSGSASTSHHDTVPANPPPFSGPTQQPRGTDAPRRSARLHNQASQAVHHIDSQRRLAAQLWGAIAHEVEIRQTTDRGRGLFAVVDLGPGYHMHYFGQFYEDAASANAAHADPQFLISQDGRSNAPHFDGAAVGQQLATMANHSSAANANAELVWDEDYGTRGQPMVRLTRQIPAGEEITVDYGPHYAYADNDFDRHSSPPCAQPQAGSQTTQHFPVFGAPDEPGTAQQRQPGPRTDPDAPAAGNTSSWGVGFRLGSEHSPPPVTDTVHDMTAGPYLPVARAATAEEIALATASLTTGPRSAHPTPAPASDGMAPPVAQVETEAEIAAACLALAGGPPPAPASTDRPSTGCMHGLYNLTVDGASHSLYECARCGHELSPAEHRDLVEARDRAQAVNADGEPVRGAGGGGHSG